MAMAADSTSVSSDYLKFKGSRIGSPGLMMLLFVILVIPSCAVTSPVAFVFDPKDDSVLIGLGLWIILSVILAFYLYVKLLTAKRSLLIGLGQGLLFDGKSLPFSDIQTVYTASAGGDLYYVCVDANGSSIRLTHYLTQPLADAIRREIMEASGNSWS